MLGLYLHIPFCQALCHYCNFNRGLLDPSLKVRYVSALKREILTAGDRRMVDTIFFGGGTPSLLEPEEVASILEACRRAYRVADDVEVTLETNPETVTLARLERFGQAGINRISLGVQSFHDEELARLGRIHTAARAADVVAWARAAGFDNLSLDLMCWLPGQSIASWLDSLEQAMALRPDHVSFYLLELYPNAPLKETMARRLAGAPEQAPDEASREWVQVDEDTAADMYLDGLRKLDEAGYAQYEISNASQPGRQSRHNLKYWTMGNWRGFGCGAHSTVDAKRWRNRASIAEYVALIDRGQPVDCDVRHIPLQEQAQEALFTGLRLSSGIDTDAVEGRFGTRVWATYGDNIAAWIDAGLMWAEGPRIGLTRRGMLVSNEVLANFV